MLRFLLRTLGLWLLAGALVAVVVDGARSIAAGAPVMTSFVHLWGYALPGSLTAAEAATPPWLWGPILVPVLELPAFAFFLVLGLLLLWSGQRPRPILPEFRPR